MCRIIYPQQGFYHPIRGRSRYAEAGRDTPHSLMMEGIDPDAPLTVKLLQKGMMQLHGMTAQLSRQALLMGRLARLPGQLL